MPDREQIKKDLDRYLQSIMTGNFNLGLAIEKRYNLDGYPPNIVSKIMSAGAAGEDMLKAEDRAIGVGEDEEDDDHA